MIKITTLVLTAAFLIGCSKNEEELPRPQQQQQEPTAVDCQCGKIMSDDVDDFSVVVKNDCSGVYKSIILHESDWMLAHVGENICLTNVPAW